MPALAQSCHSALKRFCPKTSLSGRLLITQSSPLGYLNQFILGINNLYRNGCFWHKSVIHCKIRVWQIKLKLIQINYLDSITPIEVKLATKAICNFSKWLFQWGYSIVLISRGFLVL